VFLDIPEKTAKFLYSKCENFLAQLGSGDEGNFIIFTIYSIYPCNSSLVVHIFD